MRKNYYKNKEVFTYKRVELRLCSSGSKDSRNKRFLSKKGVLTSVALSPTLTTFRSKTYYKKPTTNQTKKLSQDLKKISLKKYPTYSKIARVLQVNKQHIKDKGKIEIKVKNCKEPSKEINTLKKNSKIVRSMPDIRKNENIKELLNMSKKKLQESELR